jgi:hypothetical protein
MGQLRIRVVVRGERYSAHPHPPFYSRLLDRYFKDDVNGFPCSSTICVMVLAYWPMLKEPKLDQVECGFFYTNQTRMVR